MIPNTKKDTNYKIPLIDTLEHKNKTHFELVITRFDEDISWSDNYKKFRTIYNKGKNDLICECIQRPNFGRDGETIIHHIIENWEKLADITFFAQGAINDRNDQILDMNDVQNYVNCTDIYISKNVRCGPPGNENYYNFPKNLKEIWNEFFNEPYSRDYRWSPGMWVCVSKEMIKNVPLEKYKLLMSMWNKYHDENVDKTGRRFGIYLERMLPHLFVKYDKNKKQK